MTYVRASIALLLTISACKAGGALNWSSGSSSSGGTTPSAAPSSSSSSPSSSSDGASTVPVQVVQPEGGAPAGDKRGDYDAIGKSADKADAWFKRYGAADVKAKCGIDVALSIDFASFGETEAKQVVEENYCGQIPKMLVSACESPVGKAAVKNIKAVHCEMLKGKASKGNAKILMSDGNKHAYEWQGKDKLTIRLGGMVYGFFPRDAIAEFWPVVPWQREVEEYLPYLNKHFTNWSEDKDGVELTVDVDAKSFASAQNVPSHYFCGGDGNSMRRYPTDGKVHEFLELLWKSSAKGKKLLKTIKRVTCAVTTEPNGKTPELAGDHLTIYSRVLKDHFRASTFAATGQRFPENDAYFSYALFRKAQNLGGECPWNRTMMDKDPEGDKLCPEKN